MLNVDFPEDSVKDCRMRSGASLGHAALLTLAASFAFAADGGWTSFRFEAYNREYVNVRSNSQWEQGGAITVKVGSPSHRLAVRDHSVELKPRGQGTFEARVRVSFSGEGDLLADVGVMGAETRLEDHVVAPLQEVEVLALVRFARAEGGYELETLELPDSVEVEIESRLGKQLVQTCRQTLSLLGVRCSGLESIFSTVAAPMPSPGGSYYISDDQLSRAERRRLNRFLDRNQ